ncbi:glycerophosphodiester phosphodiesterase [Egicoccus halophilus]|uniref:Glycerophosphoryl diester phosphodiesterase n=1 Tax=Egicoccus halophilus TaxID=1670830 RepID=A0A8J3EU47_9ACTN|nr:glycerophosphodiester phosphodiesterase [Egicoccus halophilus]GGI06400.1 glycerophosphoryl diester phosphodiesterase [Egicoccus halophilus]
MRHPFLDDLPVAVAHRGGDHVGAENSLAAFEDAVALGYRCLETDVHVSRDGVPVLHHDPTLDRVTDTVGAIAGLDWVEVSRARISSREPVASFDEAMAAFPQVRWIVDVKDDLAVDPLVARLRGDDDLLQRLCLGSFSDDRLARARAALGERLCTSAGPDEVRRLRRASWCRLGRRVPLHADVLQVPVRSGRVPVVDRRFVAAAHWSGLPVHVWTVNEPAEMHRLLDLGVDGLISDRTRDLREVLRARGAWPG